MAEMATHIFRRILFKARRGSIRARVIVSCSGLDRTRRGGCMARRMDVGQTVVSETCLYWKVVCVGIAVYIEELCASIFI